MEVELTKLEKRLNELNVQWNPSDDEKKLSNMKQQIDIIKEIADRREVSHKKIEDFYNSYKNLKYYYEETKRIKNNKNLSNFEISGRVAYIHSNDIPPRLNYIERCFENIKESIKVRSDETAINNIKETDTYVKN